MASQLYLKFTNRLGHPVNGGSGKWPLPKRWSPGEWRKVNRPLELCRNGLHLAKFTNYVRWLSEACWIVETPDSMFLIDGDNKVCVRRARLICRVKNYTERNLGLAAVDLARAVIKVEKLRYGNSILCKKILADVEKHWKSPRVNKKKTKNFMEKKKRLINDLLSPYIPGKTSTFNVLFSLLDANPKNSIRDIFDMAPRKHYSFLENILSKRLGLLESALDAAAIIEREAKKKTRKK